MQLEGIDHVALAVRDIEHSAKWYSDVLGLERRYKNMWNGIPVFIGKGDTAIALFPIREGKSQTPIRSDNSGMLHLAFRADARNFAAAQTELNRRDIKFQFEDHEISHSIYFRDPDDNRLEITTYDLEGK